MKRKIYLREIYYKEGTPELSIFEGDVKSDKAYFEKYQEIYCIRYFELKEVKVK